MHTYEIVDYDVWGNTRDGYEVNAAYNTGCYVDIPDNATDYQINRILGVRGITWDGEDGHILYGTFKRNACPALELRAINNT